MADIWYDVDTALSEVPVNILPLLDATDFKTIEDAVAYNAAGLALHWHFCTTAGAYTVTAVTPTTGGDYDWTDQGTAGIYTIEIPASGGASINNDTEGFGWFTGVATGVLPWRGPVCGFRAAALNNSMIDGTTIDVNVTAMANNVVTASAVADGAIDLATFAADAKALFGVIAFGTAQSVTGTTIQLASAETFADDELIGATVLIRSATTGAGQSRVITDYVSATDTATVDTWTTTPTGTITYVVFGTAPASTSAPLAVNVTQIGGSAVTASGGIPEVKVQSIAANAITAAATAADFGAEVADAVWDEATSGHSTAGSTGKALTDASSAGDPWSTALPGAYGAGTAGKIIGDNINATISSRASQTSVDTIDDFLDTEIAAILADTNELQTDWANGGRLDLILDARASQTSVDTVDDFLDTEIAAIKAKTDSLTFTVAGQVDANIQSVNDVTVTGNGGTGTEWGP